MGVDARMFARVKEESKLNEAEVKRLAWRITEALGREPFWISRGNDCASRALKIYAHDYDDEPVANRGNDQLIEVSTVSRYYGIGYERGPLMDFINIAEWLEFNLPKGSQIYYGGDSSDEVELFDKKHRKELFNHFAEHGHSPYTGAFQSLAKDEYARYCDFCDHSMNQYGFGGNGLYAAFICYGCGLKERTDDGGETYKEVEE